MRKWTAHLDGEGVIDNTLRIISATALIVWLLFHGMLYDVPYNTKLIELHLYPWWNILLVIMVTGAVIWCPRVGILAAMAVFLYFSDMDALMNNEPVEFGGLIEAYKSGRSGISQLSML